MMFSDSFSIQDVQFNSAKDSLITSAIQTIELSEKREVHIHSGAG